MKTAKQKKMILACAAFLGLFLAGCATNGINSVDTRSHEVLEQRAQARWDAIASGNLEQAYQYYSPGFRSVTSLTDYILDMGLRRVRYTDARFLEKTCEEDSCKLKFEITYSVANAVPGVTSFSSFSTVEDTWIKTDGAWWYLPTTQ